ncbi:cell division ATP-binding protein FtsE [Butyrivibrio sp. VCD2006]|uniref:cell division ATP-binding protein FtsE n=1 Tax=Butyrivibrio sp. VCD2006 TaxID=1280664 RepID=UPI0003F4BA85|nr:cell division ATP-binding protein FtsE [Butyrivibrio sp. VCD2006]
MEKVYRRKRAAAPIPEDEIITLDNVTKSYSTGAPALNGVTLHIKKGEFVFIVGDSGSGKSTLIKLLLRELVPSDGTITVMGQDLGRMRHRNIPKFRRRLGIVFQDFRLLKDRNVYENVAFAQRIIQKSNRDIKRNVPSVLAMVGLAGKYKSKVTQLAGGEQQRVALARAIVNKPDILLADEPTGNLDPNNTLEIMKLMEQINMNGTTVIVVTHNREIVNSMHKRVITMKKGVVIYDEEEGEYHDEDE